MRKSPAWLLGLLLVAGTHAVGAQSAAAWNVEALRTSAGPTWTRVESARFQVYSEFPAPTTRALLDSLDAAWRHNAQLLGVTALDSTPITVFVTRTASRFPQHLTPVTKGAAGRSLDGRDLIVLVYNDSVRAYTRHEVMHVLARRAWGLGPAQDGEWLREGLATFADGTCQGAPLLTVARDVLRREPALTIDGVHRDFPALHRSQRAAAYVVAGSIVAYLWATRGRAGVARLWRGADSLTVAQVTIPGLGTRGSQSAEDRAWRYYVESAAGASLGLAEIAFARLGCG